MKIDSNVYELIKKQINIEFTNHASYVELSNWCSYNGYNCAAKMFTSQACDELVHRDKFLKFLLDVGLEVPMIDTNSHSTKITTLEQTFKKALILEQQTTKELLVIKDAAEKSKDYVSSALLDWYLSEQVEEEALFIDLMDACKNIGLLDSDTPEWAKKQMRQMIENRIEDSCSA